MMAEKIDRDVEIETGNDWSTGSIQAISDHSHHSLETRPDRQMVTTQTWR
jgi:hypothetical protein